MTAVVRMGWAEESQLQARAASSGSPKVEFSLEKLHELPKHGGDVPGCPAVLAAFKLAGVSVPAEWGSWMKPGKRGRQRHIREFRASPEYAAFLDAYRRFIADIVVPLVDDPRGMIFQCPPTLRVVFPSDRATGRPHRDSEYIGHEASEVNFWVPMMDVFGSNTLQSESAPGVGDFRAWELGYGEFMRFNGSYCSHHTLPNQTISTRVSFDFRVIPRSWWLDNFGRRIGDYDCELALPAAAVETAA